MKFVIYAVALFCFLTPNLAFSEKLNTEKMEAIDKLLKVTGTLEYTDLMATAMIEQISEVIRSVKPDIDVKAIEIINDETKALFQEEIYKKNTLFPLMYPIYHKYLTLAEINQLIEFYESPIGRKSIAVMPKMTQEGMAVGQRWGMSLSSKLQRRIDDRFRKEGIEM